MKNLFKKTLCLLTALVLLGLCGCGGAEEAATDKEAPDGYYIKVVDALGTPYTDGVVVDFLKDGASAGMQKTDEKGVAAKDLADGTYTVKLSFNDPNAKYHHDADSVTLTPDKKNATVTMAMLPGAEDTLYVGNKSKKAYAVTAGCTYVTLEKGERNYFLFTPTVAGDYEISLPGSTAAVGYYGMPHYVQELHAGEEIKDGKFKATIKASMIGTNGTGTTVMVLGIDAGDNENATLAINRIGDPTRDVTDEPWVTYAAKTKPTAYKLPAGATLKDFDLKAATYTLVLDDKGQYHLNTKDGPLVLMRLGKKSEYLDDFKTICEKSHVCKYFYNEDGSFLKKESYNDCLLEYIAAMDEDAGVYPLTEDLKYIIQQRGDHYGWFDADGGQYLFKDQNGNNIPGINAENAWLFPCVYLG